jgi:hypothetical protein
MRRKNRPRGMAGLCARHADLFPFIADGNYNPHDFRMPTSSMHDMLLLNLHCQLYFLLKLM